MTLKSKKLGKGRWVLGDCIEAMKKLPDNCIDLVLCDLPYGTTNLSWDKIIPMDKLWEQYKRLITYTGAIVLTSNQPFTSFLIMSNIKMFKYTWVWRKNKVTGFANAKYRPLKCFEDVCVFSKAPAANVTNVGKLAMVYNPQGLTPYGKTETNKRKHRKKDSQLPLGRSIKESYIRQFTGYPRNVIEFDTHTNGFHPTQKPVPLFEYLIKTYSNEGDLVLDNCAGSGTTAIACEHTNRRWLCIEQDKEYSNKALARIRECVKGGKL